jgi:hypothetical protein
MKVGRLIFLGALIGLAACVWLTLTRPRHSDNVAIPPAATPTPAPNTSPSGPTPIVAGTASIRVLLYDATLTLTDPVTDLVYGPVKDGSNTWAGFTTKSLLARYPSCKAGALGTLVRVKAPSPSPSPSPRTSPSPSPSPSPSRSPSIKQPFKKTINGYTYTYRPAYFDCTTDQAGRDMLAADRAAIINGVIPTLSN